jgi:hypothetical protein
MPFVITAGYFEMVEVLFVPAKVCPILLIPVCFLVPKLSYRLSE